jgi:hypothetical protein
VGNTLSFILTTIYRAFNEGEDKNARDKIEKAWSTPVDKQKFKYKYGSDFIIDTFLKNHYLYIYIIYLDNLISTYDEMKHALFYILSDPSNEIDRSAPIWQEAHENLFSVQLKKIINTPERKAQNKKVLSIIYYLFTELTQFCNFKTF